MDDLERAHRHFWAKGKLSWLLRKDQHQLDGYEHYRKWEQLPYDAHDEIAQYGRIYVLDWGRRTGKTTMRFLIRCEDCIRHPLLYGRPGFYRYASAFQRNIEEIVDEVSGFVLETCPLDLRPKYHVASKARGAGFYFPNGSALRLVGLDKDPNGLRGRASDGDDISEAAYVRHLMYNIQSVLTPQYQGRDYARMCVESTAPEEPDSDYDRKLVEDAKKRGAYSFATIYDNKRLSERERDHFIQQAGGLDDPTCQREYLGKRVRDAETVVVPAFDEARHVRAFDTPEWALCYTFGDAAWWPDLFALQWLWIDYEQAKLCVRSDWVAHNAGTKEVAEVARAGELECFEGVRRWDGKRVLQQWAPPPPTDDGIVVLGADRDEDHRLHRPYGRIMDCEPRLRAELVSADADLCKERQEAGDLLTPRDALAFGTATNRDVDAQYHALNRLFADDKVWIHPDAVATIAHVRAAHRGPNGKLARSDIHGHFDAMRCLAYAAVMVDWHTDPKPPAWALDRSLVVTPAMKREAGRPSTKAVSEAFKPQRWKAGAKRGVRR